jgi:hypothetical protein
MASDVNKVSVIRCVSFEQGRIGWKKLWQVKVPSKVRAFAMKVANNGLPTRVNKKYCHLEQ